MMPITSLFPADLQSLAIGANNSLNESKPAETATLLSKEDESNAGLKRTRRSSRGTAARKLASDEFLHQKTSEALLRLERKQHSRVPLQQVIPGWDDERRGVPNGFARSGLFSAASAKKPREDMRDELINSLSNYSISYSGDELRMDDFAVWIAIVNMGRHRPVGEPIQFTGYKLINDLDWRMHSDSYKAVKEIIDRLKFTSVKFSTDDQKSQYAGSLIRDYLFDDTNSDGKVCWTVRLEDSIERLFREDTTTLLEWELHRSLGRRATLAKWLLSFYATHATPFPYHLEKLRELCRSEDKHITSFRANVRRALEKLVAAGFLESYCIRNDFVHVVRAKRFEDLKRIPA